MIKIVVLFLFMGLFLKCSESQPTESETEIALSGVVYSQDSNSTIEGLIVTLKGSGTITDTSDSEGVFNFILKAEGEYTLSIISGPYQNFDSTLFISKDIDLNIYLSNLNDYLPLSINNSWTYSFLLYPRASDWLNHWQEGEISWTINDKLESAQTTVFKIEKITNGIEVNYNFNTLEYDTTIITNMKEEIEFIEYKDGYVELGKGFYNIKIKRYHTDSSEYLIFDSYYSYPFSANNNIIHDDYTGHRIKLIKNVGIMDWNIDNRSNSGTDGDLNLIDYDIN